MCARPYILLYLVSPKICWTNRELPVAMGVQTPVFLDGSDGIAIENMRRPKNVFVFHAGKRLDYAWLCNLNA
jgi:hypothetical protein